MTSEELLKYITKAELGYQHGLIDYANDVTALVQEIQRLRTRISMAEQIYLTANSNTDRDAAVDDMYTALSGLRAV